MRRQDVEKLVKKYGPIFQKDLGLGHKTVRWHTHLEISDTDYSAAITMLDEDENVVDIVIHYDNAVNRADVLGSIFHELVHVWFHDLRCVIKKKDIDKRAHDIEENIVKHLESFFLKYLVRKK